MGPPHEGSIRRPIEPLAISNSIDNTSNDKVLTTINYNVFLTAQIYWLVKVSLSNYSLQPEDRIGDTFTAIFPDSKIAQKFSLSRSSASYMIGEGLKPYIKTILCADIKASVTVIQCSHLVYTSMKQQLHKIKNRWT